MRHAVIDIGTNSILMLVCDISRSGSVQVMRDEARITRLGAGLKHKNIIGEEAYKRTAATIREYIQHCDDLNVDETDVIGTEVLRRAENSEEIKTKLRELTGLSVVVLSGKEEAAFSFRSALPDKVEGDSRYLVIDIGGGSTEIIYGGINDYSTWSLPFGAVPLTEEYLHHDPPDQTEIENMKSDICERFLRLPVFEKITTAIGIGGTITTLAAIKLNLSQFDPARIEGVNLKHGELSSIFNALRARDRLSIAGMEKGREDIITAGTAILLEFLKHFRLRSIRVSARGVRWGYMLSKISNSKNP